MKNEEPTGRGSAEPSAAPERSLEELFAEGDRIIRQMDQIVHDELNHQPEAIAEWEEIMRDYEANLAADQREAEEAKLAREMDEWIARLNADVDRLSKLDFADLEFDETLARTFESWNEADTVMRRRCRDYPEKFARWENEVMGPVRKWEAVVADAREKEEAKPGN